MRLRGEKDEKERAQKKSEEEKSENKERGLWQRPQPHTTT